MIHETSTLTESTRMNIHFQSTILRQHMKQIHAGSYSMVSGHTLSSIQAIICLGFNKVHIIPYKVAMNQGENGRSLEGISTPIKAYFEYLREQELIETPLDFEQSDEGVSNALYLVEMELEYLNEEIINHKIEDMFQLMARGIAGFVIMDYHSVHTLEGPQNMLHPTSKMKGFLEAFHSRCKQEKVDPVLILQSNMLDYTLGYSQDPIEQTTWLAPKEDVPSYIEMITFAKDRGYSNEQIDDSIINWKGRAELMDLENAAKHLIGTPNRRGEEITDEELEMILKNCVNLDEKMDQLRALSVSFYWDYRKSLTLDGFHDVSITPSYLYLRHSQFYSYVDGFLFSEANHGAAQSHSLITIKAVARHHLKNYPHQFLGYRIVGLDPETIELDPTGNKIGEYLVEFQRAGIKWCVIAMGNDVINTMIPWSNTEPLLNYFLGLYSKLLLDIYSPLRKADMLSLDTKQIQRFEEKRERLMTKFHCGLLPFRSVKSGLPLLSRSLAEVPIEKAQDNKRSNPISRIEHQYKSDSEANSLPRLNSDSASAHQDINKNMIRIHGMLIPESYLMPAQEMGLDVSIASESHSAEASPNFSHPHLYSSMKFSPSPHNSTFFCPNSPFTPIPELEYSPMPFSLINHPNHTDLPSPSEIAKAMIPRAMHPYDLYVLEQLQRDAHEPSHADTEVIVNDSDDEVRF